MTDIRQRCIAQFPGPVGSYLWRLAAGQIFLVFLYPKNVRSELSPAELRTLRKLVADN